MRYWVGVGAIIMKFIRNSLGVGIMAAMLMAPVDPLAAGDFSPYVDESGNITRPKEFLQWEFIGFQQLELKNDKKRVEIHNVYTELETINAYRETGAFPDGAVFVKEMLKLPLDAPNDGNPDPNAERIGWFVMIKDTEGRFEGNKIWGKGWGWALYKVKKPEKNTTKSFRRECIGCHIPAKDTEYINIHSYAALSE